MDLFVGFTNANNELRLGDGSGGLTPVTTAAATGHSTHAAMAGDFNGDGLLDIFVGNSDGDPNELWLGDDGSSGFTSASGGPTGSAGATTSAAGDFNADGLLDLFVGSCGDDARDTNNDELWLGDGSGGFTSASGGPGSPAHSIVECAKTSMALDYNGDGFMDLLVGGACRRGLCSDDATCALCIVLWLNDGSGSLSASTTVIDSGDVGLPLSGRDGASHVCAAGDFNEDGYLDIFIPLYGAPDKLLLSAGSSGFTSVTGIPLVLTDSAADYSVTTTAADFNGDGSIDIFVGKLDSRNTLWYGDGNGGFTEASAGPITTSLAASVTAAGDFNGDGDLDFYVGVNSDTYQLYENGFPSGTQPLNDALWLSDGSGGFSTSKSISLPDYDQSVIKTVAVAADFNGDGRLDLFLGTGARSLSAPTANALWLGDGQGNFMASTGPPVGTSARAVTAVAGDFNGDGSLDLFVGNSDGPNQLYFYGVCPNGGVRLSTGGCATCASLAET